MSVSESTGVLDLPVRAPSPPAPRPLAPAPRPPAPRRARVRASTAIVLAVGILAAVVRVQLTVRSGFTAIGAYDDGVYFSASELLVHGRLPYRDFVFLHPPGLPLLLAPVSAAAALLGDAHAFALARLATGLVGASSAALVALLLRGRGRAAMVVGGGLYAVAHTAVYAERTVLLEAVGTPFVLLALLALQRARSGGGRAAIWFLVAGAAAGAACTVKIWYVVPLLVVAAAAGRASWRVLAGAAGVGAAVLLPFVLAAPRAAVHEVVLAQLGRPHDPAHLGARLGRILGVYGSATTPGMPLLPAVVQVAGLLALAALAAAVAITDRGARVWVALTAASGAVLLASPSFFPHYGALTAAPLALVVAAAVSVVVRRVRAGTSRRVAAVVASAGVLLVAASSNLPHDLQPAGSPRSWRGLAVAAAQVHGCVVADDPTVLVMADALGPDLARGCRVEPDTSGAGYVWPGPDGTRADDPAYQRWIAGYLRSGDAVVLSRGGSLGLDRATRALVAEAPVLYPGPPFALRGRLP